MESWFCADGRAVKNRNTVVLHERPNNYCFWEHNIFFYYLKKYYFKKDLLFKTIICLEFFLNQDFAEEFKFEFAYHLEIRHIWLIIHPFLYIVLVLYTLEARQTTSSHLVAAPDRLRHDEAGERHIQDTIERENRDWESLKKRLRKKEMTDKSIWERRAELRLFNSRGRGARKRGGLHCSMVYCIVINFFILKCTNHTSIIRLIEQVLKKITIMPLCQSSVIRGSNCFDEIEIVEDLEVISGRINSLNYRCHFVRWCVHNWKLNLYPNNRWILIITVEPKCKYPNINIFPEFYHVFIYYPNQWNP